MVVRLTRATATLTLKKHNLPFFVKLDAYAFMVLSKWFVCNLSTEL